jgi:DNA processing protein
MTIDACDPCLRRTHLVGALGARIDRVARGRAAQGALLALPDDELLKALRATQDAEVHRAREAFTPDAARAQIEEAGLGAVCCHARGYPSQLLDLEDAPAVLHVAGDAGALSRIAREDGTADAIAVVGARQATPYGLDVAHALGHGLAKAGMTVVSGMALGIDSAAHAGALAGGGPTVAVLASGADVPYPPSKAGLYGRIRAHGCVVSELPPGTDVRRWGFPARNRIIAALGAATVVVEARERSGSLITSEIAADLGRPVGAVPGAVTSQRSVGSNALLHDGAAMVRDARDALDLAAAPPQPIRRVARRPAPPRAAAPAPEPGPALPDDPALRRALDAVEGGADTPDRLADALGTDIGSAVVVLTRLELQGWLGRRADGSSRRRVRP